MSQESFANTNQNTSSPSSVVKSLQSVPDGHPAKTLHWENLALEEQLDQLEAMIAADDQIEKICAVFPKLNALHRHYGNKEMLFMPILYRHEVVGPSQVMWTDDDRIKKDIRTLSRDLSPAVYEECRQQISDVISRIRQMIIKDEKILITLSFRFFTEQEWLMIYRDYADMGTAFLPEFPRWIEGDEWLNKDGAAKEPRFDDGKIKLPTGELTIQQLKGILSLVPADITFIDKDDTLRFFINEGKIFDRPLLALGNNVYDCHPSEVIPVIQQLLEDFKSKKRSSMEVWRKIKGHPVSVKYLAVYDDAGEYAGTVEFVQDLSDAMEHFSDK